MAFAWGRVFDGGEVAGLQAATLLRDVPTQYGPVIAAAAGYSHSLVLLSEGAIASYGAPDEALLGRAGAIV